MKLSAESLKDKAAWEEKGYRLPQFDREAVAKATHEAPEWVHFGAGNIFRAFQANVLQNILNAGEYDKGLIAVEGFDHEIVEKAYRANDNLSLLVTLKSDGSIEKTVVGSIVETCILDPNFEDEFGRLKEIFRAPSLKMGSFTITEKGYSLVNGKGEQLPAVTADFANGPAAPASYLGKVFALLYERYLAGAYPIAMVSMDNCSHNGDRLFAAADAYAKEWAKNGLVDEGFVSYIEDPKKVSFPWSMIDKITPRPDASVEAILRADGFEGLDPIVTTRGTHVAPFVNSEESEYLVIEDSFPNGRVPLDKGGIIYTDRETVDKVETMKVCTCLNPLHTSLAVFGCILGYDKISAEMKDPELKKLVDIVGYTEGLPVVVNPGVIDPKEFIDTVLNVRIPNPFMPDTPQRIATDTSQKLAIRFGGTIKKYAASETLSVSDLKFIPLVLAGWCRYLMAVDDEGNAFTLSDDPLLETVCPYVASFKLGDGTTAEEAKAKLLPLLKDAKIFGVDLEEVGLADTVASYFAELIAGKGAVRATLKKYLA
ncbi:MAG: mannitol dehydrogenase family protein [Lachnospiraceae bacterium]|nr:mannitol dehydrogenase family protein [Lachnospiraceae bacterium]